MSIIYGHLSTLKMSTERPKKLYALGMPSVAPLLKQLRLTAVPPISLRQTAEKLGMGHSSYGVYESANSYKKPYLPIELARRLAAIFVDHGIDPADVMRLAGLKGDEAEPEAREIVASRPAVQFVTLPVALPSEAALSDMFESLLALVPPEASRAEAARILAQRLPSGFAAIGSVVLDPGSGHETALAAVPRSSAKGRRAPTRSSRT